MWEVPAGAGSTGGPAYRPSMAIAENCSCISDPQGCGKCPQVPGAPAGRRTDHPWPSPEIAPAFPAYRPSMAIKKKTDRSSTGPSCGEWSLTRRALAHPGRPICGAHARHFLFVGWDVGNTSRLQLSQWSCQREIAEATQGSCGFSSMYSCISPS